MPQTPRGYWAEEYPLPHDSTGYFGLTMSSASATKQATILPLFRSSEKLVNPENVQVNPRNTEFAEESGLTCYVGSIIPKVKFAMTIKLTTGAVETDKIREAIIYWWPIYIAFHENLTALDSKTGESVGDLLELDDTIQGDKQIKVLFNGTDLTTQNVSDFSSTGEAFGSWGLTTDKKIEGITFNHTQLYQALSYFTNKGMLKSSIGQIRRVRLSRDRGYHYYSNNFTFPKVKRMNEYTFCGCCFYVPPKDATNSGSFNINQGNTITNIDHFVVNYRTEFDEWNSNFDQGAQ